MNFLKFEELDVKKYENFDIHKNTIYYNTIIK